MSTNNGSARPKWATQVIELHETAVAQAFILHFNVRDYASPDALILVPDYLVQLLAKRDVVAIYSRDKGIEFGSDGQKQRALGILGLNQGQDNDPALAALRATGFASQASEVNLPSDPASALPLLDTLMRSDSRVAVIVDGAELIIPAADIATMQPPDRVALATIRRWGNDTQISQSGNMAFLITNNLSNLHPDLRAASAKFEAIEVSLPDQDTRDRFITRWLSERGNSVDLGDLTIQAVANATAGLSILHVEDILLRAESSGKLTQDLIWARKEAIIRSEFGEVLEVIQPRMDFSDIGGLDYIKDFFTRSVIRPIREGRWNRVPMGVLMTGPAGTGKSIMAEAVATEAQVNAVRLRIGGQIASKWQGQGERNLELALSAISGLAPTIVFIDEIDQSLKRGGADSSNQQDSRIFNRLLEFMADTSHRGQIVFLAATNRPDLMDAALRRPGRFDRKIPFLVPDEQERAAIVTVMSQKYCNDPVKASKGFITATEGWTGAELEAVAVKAAELMEDYSLSAIDAMEKAVTKLSPSTADIQLMTLLAIQECNDKDLLPPRYQGMVEDRKVLDEKVEQAQANSTTGRRRAREF
jgi:transitional endoplasmic reticulum ATPase